MNRSKLRSLQAEIESDFAGLETVINEIREIREGLVTLEPTHKDKAALGAFVHSFYNGIENILKRLAQEIENSVPVGEGWHRTLLRRMTAEVKGVRPRVLKRETVKALEPYLGFRHFFRHSYTFEIDWQKLQPLVDDVENVFRRFRQDVEHFFSTQLD